MMILAIPDEKQFVRTLYDNHIARLPAFSVGETIPLEVALLSRNWHPWDSRVFTPIDPTDWTVKASLGGFRLPVSSGTIAISYASVASATLVPAFLPAASDVSAAINALAAIISAGGVTVTGGSGFFTVTFNSVGARTLFTADATLAVPTFLLEFKRQIPGNGTTAEVQTLSIPATVDSIAILSTDSASPTATITVLVAGDGTHSQKVRVTLPTQRWGGEWTMTVATHPTDLIGWDDPAELIQGFLERTTGVGTGNVYVTRDGDDSFVILFRAALANTAITVTADGTILKVVQTKGGTLDLRLSMGRFLLLCAPSSLATLEIEVTPPSGTPQKIHRDVLLTGPVLCFTQSDLNSLLAGLGVGNVCGGSGFTGFDNLPQWDNFTLSYYGATNNLRTVIYTLQSVEVARINLDYAGGGAADNDVLIDGTLTIP